MSHSWTQVPVHTHTVMRRCVCTNMHACSLSLSLLTVYNSNSCFNSVVHMSYNRITYDYKTIEHEKNAGGGIYIFGVTVGCNDLGVGQ